MECIDGLDAFMPPRRCESSFGVLLSDTLTLKRLSSLVVQPGVINLAYLTRQRRRMRGGRGEGARSHIVSAAIKRICPRRWSVSISMDCATQPQLAASPLFLSLSVPFSFFPPRGVPTGAVFHARAAAVHRAGNRDAGNSDVMYRATSVAETLDHRNGYNNRSAPTCP